MTEDKKSIFGRLRDQLPEMPTLQMPKLGREVEIPVYVIHNSPDAEDYFFIFDFEQFVERSRSGMFVRPKLKVWAGRTDFDRRLFGRQFRQSFAAEFETMRRALKAKDGNAGWISWDIGTDLVSGAAVSLVANVVLVLATTTGRVVWDMLPIPRWLQGKSASEKLEAEIDETKSSVETALAGLDLVLHRDLYRHAYRGTSPGALVGMDYDAWPLPDFVVTHLTDRSSTSWW